MFYTDQASTHAHTHKYLFNRLLRNRVERTELHVTVGVEQGVRDSGKTLPKQKKSKKHFGKTFLYDGKKNKIQFTISFWGRITSNMVSSSLGEMDDKFSPTFSFLFRFDISESITGYSFSGPPVGIAVAVVVAVVREV